MKLVPNLQQNNIEVYILLKLHYKSRQDIFLQHILFIKFLFYIKDRIHNMCCANDTGNYKLSLLVIGKAIKPR